ncbi:TetR/AcrR family transcriptional regulator [Streptomyces sp. M10(2022)]
MTPGKRKAPGRGESRAALIAVAGDLFARKPYDEIHISEIAQEAGWPTVCSPTTSRGNEGSTSLSSPRRWTRSTRCSSRRRTRRTRRPPGKSD